MSLCTLCASIDLLAIPRLPKIYDGYTLPGAESVLISILKNPLARTSSATQSQSTAAPSAPDDEGNASLGTPYHPTLPSLQDSAQTCALCKIVLHDVERFQREFDGQDEERKGRSGKPDYSMVLARGARIGVDTSGFMVLCGDMERKKKLWVLGAVGIAVRDGDGLAGIVKGRVIEEIVLEEGSSGGIGLERMRQWMRECDEGCGNRGLKCGSGGERELPERMIRVGSKQDDVVEVEELGGKKGKYAVLSYVAEEEDIKRIRKDIEDMEESSRISMQWRRYPSVYQDAVVLTRELGLEFLWIDALCLTDKDLARPHISRDIPSFISIFTNASIVLSADRSLNPTSGFLAPRTPPQYTSIPYTYTESTTTKPLTATIHLSSAPLQNSIYPLKPQALRSEPLTKSAWAMQERYFAPRILHFGSEQMYFECYGNFLSEDGLSMVGRIDAVCPTRKPQIEGKDIIEEVIDKAGIWQNIIGTYCRKELGQGREGDKLPALANLALAVDKLPHSSTDASDTLDADVQEQDTYLAGLWKSHLVEGLIWQSVGFTSNKSSSPPQYRAPSWSWASINGPFGAFSKGVEFDAGEWIDLISIISVHTTLEDDNKPYGKVTDGSIEMMAPMVELFMCEDGKSKVTNQGWRMRTEEGDKGGTFCIFDTPERAEEARVGGLWALVVSKHRGGGSETFGYHGLVVTRVEEREGVWRRVGKVVFSEEQLGEGRWKDGKGEGVEKVMLI